MKVNVKENREIPEGYTYRWCDTYTEAEFIQACSVNYESKFWSITESKKDNPHAVAYVKKHKKPEYTSEDVMAVLSKTIQ